MGNPVKGEVSFEANGQTYTFKFGTNAQAIFEKHVGKNVAQFMKEKGENLGATDIRLIFYCGLYQKHPMTEDEVGDLIDAIGPEKAAQVFIEAINLAAAPAKPNGAGEVEIEDRPTKQRIGMNS